MATKKTTRQVLKTMGEGAVLSSWVPPGGYHRYRVVTLGGLVWDVYSHTNDLSEARRSLADAKRTGYRAKLINRAGEVLA